MFSKWSLIDVLPPLGADEAQLWRVDLTGTPKDSDRYTSILSATEQELANRRRPGLVREHFMIGRSCLRVLLGNSLGVDPRSVNIANGIHGKPEISARYGSTVSFNVAHSKDTILIALSRNGSVGVDVEYLDSRTNIMEVARASFAENESNALAAITDPETRRRVFYLYWTRKEAVVKADGRGLLLPLSSFDVSVELANQHPVQVNEDSDRSSKLYFVSDIDLNSHAMAAIALEARDCRVTKLTFPLDLYPASSEKD